MCEILRSVYMTFKCFLYWLLQDTLQIKTVFTAERKAHAVALAAQLQGHGASEPEDDGPFDGAPVGGGDPDPELPELVGAP